MVWTARATQSWAPPQKTRQSLGSVMPVRTELPPAVSCVPTRMASSRRQMPGGGSLSHTDPVGSWHSQEAASGTCSGANNASVNDLSWLICWGQCKLNATHILCWEEKKVGLRQTERGRESTEQWEKGMEARAEIEEEKEWEKRVCYVKRGDFSHVITDSAPQLGCTRIYYFTRAWKTQQIKLWSCCLLEMDIFILDFRFSSPKSTFEILS